MSRKFFLRMKTLTSDFTVPSVLAELTQRFGIAPPAPAPRDELTPHSDLRFRYAPCRHSPKRGASVYVLMRLYCRQQNNGRLQKSL